jgi:hypothetical protein
MNKAQIHYYDTPSSPPPEPETIEIKSKPSVLTVAKKIIKDIDGKDKTMKILQYFIKILLHYKLVKAKYFSTVTSHFSMTRKILRLGNEVGPIHELSENKQLTTVEKISLYNDLLNTISDDIFCLYKLGVFGDYLGKQSEIVAAYCWFIGIMFDMKNNIRSYKKQQKQVLKTKGQEKQDLLFKIYVTEVSIIKLLMDGIFCGKSKTTKNRYTL